MATSETGQLPYLRDPDVRLMLRVKEGDDAAFAELVENYQDRLVGVFWHVLHDPSSAEDLAQETFLRVYRARHGYTPTAKFSTWIFRIANNLASNSRRGKFRRKEVSLATNESGPLTSGAAERYLADKSGMMPSRQFAKIEMRAIVQAAMETLNDRQKTALLLHKFEGMSYEDIAETMELTTAAVKSLLSRARESLRAALEQYVK